MTAPAPLALEAAGSLAACMAETADKAIVRHLIRTRAEGGKMPSTAILPPLGQVAARILDGDGTDEAARWWLSQAQAREDAAQLAAWETDGGA